MSVAVKPTASGKTSLSRRAPGSLMEQQRPLFLGVSFGHPKGGVGSLGPFVKTSSGQIGIVSVSLVLAPKDARIGDRIHQPGVIDAGLLTGGTRVATLKAAVAPQPGKSTNVAAALAELLPGIEIRGNVLPDEAAEAGRTITGVLDAGEINLRDEVAFVGCGSGYSRGMISALNFNNVAVDHFVFDGLIAAVGDGDRFSRPGDIGALVYRVSDCRAVGLVFASMEMGSGQSETYILPLAPALAALDVELL